MLINTFHNEIYTTQNTPCRVVATPSFRNSVDKPSTSAGLCFDMNTKYCNKCKTIKSTSEFTPKYTICKKCRQKYVKEYNQRNNLYKGDENIINLPNETWVPIKDFRGYEVSNLGRIKSLAKDIPSYNEKRLVHKNQKLKTLIFTKDGYFSVRLTKNKHTGNYRVHRLVADAFIPNPDNKPIINHKNGIKTDNRVENLEWCTLSENAQHALKTGLIKRPKGEKSYTSKTSDAQKLEMYDLYNSGKSCIEIARIYNISPRNVRWNVKQNLYVQKLLKNRNLNEK